MDVIIKSGNSLIPIEIKSAETFDKFFLRTLKLFKQTAGDRVPKGYIVYSGSMEQKLGDFELLNYRNLQTVWEE